MTEYAAPISLYEAENSMQSALCVFDAMSADGEDGQEEDQGGNYYLEGVDPIESRNFQVFNAQLAQAAKKIGNTVLVGGCGGGLEAEVLALNGYEVTAFDYSPNMVEITRSRLEQSGNQATLHVDDVTSLDLSRYQPRFAGVSLLQVVQFIPVVENDRLLDKAISDLSSLTPEGVFYISTTQYADPLFTRTWKKKDGESGSTTYYARPAQAIMGLLAKNGLTIVHHEHFDAGTTPPDDYKNDYIIAAHS